MQIRHLVRQNMNLTILDFDNLSDLLYALNVAFAALDPSEFQLFYLLFFIGLSYWTTTTLFQNISRQPKTHKYFLNFLDLLDITLLKDRKLLQTLRKINPDFQLPLYQLSFGKYYSQKPFFVCSINYRFPQNISNNKIKGNANN